MNRIFQAEQIYKIGKGLEELSNEFPELKRNLENFEDELEGAEMGTALLGCIIDNYETIRRNYENRRGNQGSP